MTNERPICGACKKKMTPLNSSIAPELFLCDDCAVLHGYGTPIQRINRRKISHIEILSELLIQPQPGMPELPTAWREIFEHHVGAALGEYLAQQISRQ